MLSVGLFQSKNLLLYFREESEWKGHGKGCWVAGNSKLSLINFCLIRSLFCLVSFPRYWISLGEEARQRSAFNDPKNKDWTVLYRTSLYCTTAQFGSRVLSPKALGTLGQTLFCRGDLGNHVEVSISCVCVFGLLISLCDWEKPLSWDLLPLSLSFFPTSRLGLVNGAVCWKEEKNCVHTNNTDVLLNPAIVAPKLRSLLSLTLISCLFTIISSHHLSRERLFFPFFPSFPFWSCCCITVQCTVLFLYGKALYYRFDRLICRWSAAAAASKNSQVEGTSTWTFLCVCPSCCSKRERRKRRQWHSWLTCWEVVADADDAGKGCVGPRYSWVLVRKRTTFFRFTPLWATPFHPGN